MAFSGFPDEAFSFYERLAADNSRAFWLANKAEYMQAVRAPLDALLADLDEYGPFHVFRPYKDVRFSKEKIPFKDHQGAYGESQGGAGFYVQLSAHGLMAATGYYAMASDQLVRFRKAIDANVVGAQIASIADGMVRKGYSLGAIGALKTAPRGYPKNHSRIDLLRRKGLMATRHWKPSAWMNTRAVVKRVRETWVAGQEMNEWLDLHVGPSTLAPDDEIARFGPI